MQKTLLRLLLIAVFFNTVVGAPLHELGHLGQSMQQVAQLGGSVAGDRDEEGGEQPPARQAAQLCAECLLQSAFASALLPALPALPPLTRAAHTVWPVRATRFTPSPGGWPFAARDPPFVMR